MRHPTRMVLLFTLALSACQDAVPPTAPNAPSEEATADQGRGAAERRPSVTVVYLVPRDREVRQVYRLAVQRAMLVLQQWFGKRLRGQSFVLSDPIVRVVRTSHDAAWYATTPNPISTDPTLWFWWNAVEDAFALTGGSFNDPQHIWIYYLDADAGCGQIGGAGTSGVALLPAHDLRGLTGRRGIDPCTMQPAPEEPTCRWVGGLGHELGHALGLPHPPACETGDPSCPTLALMWLGYQTFPATDLLAADKEHLSESPFIRRLSIPGRTRSCTRGALVGR